MAAPVTILPDPPANKGIDYAYLKAEGTELVQQLSGKVWTDYNEHDPGVTALEQLCYALTELSYRAEFPLEDLLINRPGGRINPRRQALFIPRRILPCNPLTTNDYRKLIVDRVPAVANAWFIPCRPGDETPRPTDAEPLAEPVSQTGALPLTEPSDPPEFVNGLYDIWLYTPGADPCADDEEHLPDAVVKKTRRVYCRHRDLCEDVNSIRILEPLRTIVSADASIEESATPEAILARLFFNLGNFLAPELRRFSLKSMVERGLTADEIFNGPLLRNGFIDDDQLQPKAARISVQQIIRVIARSPGVTSVRNVAVKVGDRTVRDGNEWVSVPEDKILQLDTRPQENGSFTIRLFKNGIEYRPRPERVRRELDKLWAEYRRTYRLAAQYEEFFGVPKGRFRNVKRYYSVQNQFPNVYGINCYGLPGNAPAARQAQARQFKAYLLVFDQMLADFFAQLARVRDLYSIKYGLRHTYFYQYLFESVPNVVPLLKNDYKRGLRKIVEGGDPFVERRNRFLSFLLALYAERLDASSVADLNAGEREYEDSDRRLMGARLDLLHHMVRSTHDRGRGFDYLGAPSPRNIAGMEIKSRIQLGMGAADRRPLIDVLDECGLDVVEGDHEATIGRPLSRQTEHIEGHFVPVRAAVEERKSGGEKGVVKPISPLGAQRLSEEFVRTASDIANYRAGSLPGDDAVSVVCKAPGGAEWRLVGRFADRDSALDAACNFADTMRRLHAHCRQLYIVEHTLLRFGRREARDVPSRELYPDVEGTAPADSNRQSDEACENDTFQYSFTITAIISITRAERNDPDYKRFIRDVIRQNTPAHIAVGYCFLDPCRMRDFEFRYWAWRRALRRGDPWEIAIASARLRKFLERCRRHCW